MDSTGKKNQSLTKSLPANTNIEIQCYMLLAPKGTKTWSQTRNVLFHTMMCIKRYTIFYLANNHQLEKKLITQQIPDKRSCQDAGVPQKWCNCFVKTDGRNHLHSQKGEI